MSVKVKTTSITVSAELARQVRADAIRKNKSAGGTFNEILRYFLLFKKDERDRIISKAPAKQFGRKVKA